MAILLNLSPEIEQHIRSDAEQLGLTLEQYLVEETCLMAPHCVQRTPPFETARLESERNLRARKSGWPNR